MAEDRAALVTGAARGIGRQVALTLAERGYRIAANDPDASEDIARTVSFLADPEWSGFVNGHMLSADGGWFADGSWEGLRRGKQGLR